MITIEFSKKALVEYAEFLSGVSPGDLLDGFGVVRKVKRLDGGKKIRVVLDIGKDGKGHGKAI